MIWFGPRLFPSNRSSRSDRFGLSINTSMSRVNPSVPIPATTPQPRAATLHDRSIDWIACGTSLLRSSAARNSSAPRLSWNASIAQASARNAQRRAEPELLLLPLWLFVAGVPLLLVWSLLSLGPLASPRTDASSA